MMIDKKINLILLIFRLLKILSKAAIQLHFIIKYTKKRGNGFKKEAKNTNSQRRFY